ncbi:MAG: hypothetical protein FIO02_00990 [Nitrosopumilales archaeon]|jgi:hypothetical protein|nr:hypothetical protein [Nitrosopumilales archaeon]
MRAANKSELVGMFTGEIYSDEAVLVAQMNVDRWSAIDHKTKGQLTGIVGQAISVDAI